MSSHGNFFSLERTIYILLSGLLVGLIFSFNQSSRLTLINAHSENLESDSRVKKATLSDVLHTLRDENFLVIDVRPPVVFSAGSLPHAVNISANTELISSTTEVLKTRNWSGVLIYGHNRSTEPYTTARSFSKIFHGTVLVYEEGWDEWTNSGVQWISSK